MERFVRPSWPGARCPWAGALVVGLAAGFAAGARAQAPPAAPAVAAVEALRRQDFARALEIVEEARPAVAAARGEDDPAVLTLRVLGAQAEFGLGRPEGAIATLDPFLRALEAPAPLVSPTSDWNALNVLGDSFMAVGRWNEALRCLERAFGFVEGEQREGERLPGRSRGVDRATTLGKIGTVKARLGDWAGAKASFEAQAAALAGEPDGGGAYLAAAHSGLGLVADNTGDHVTAGVHYAEAAKIYGEIFGPDHPYAKRSRETLALARSRRESIGEPVRTSDDTASPADAASDPPATPAARLGWPAAAAVAAAVLLGWLLWSGFLRRGPGVTGPSEGEG